MWLSTKHKQTNNLIKTGSVQFSRSVMSDSLQPHESQHAREHCPSPSPAFTQSHIHRVSEAIQPSHPQSSPSPPAPNPSQHQSFFQWVNSAWGGQSTGVSALASLLPKNTQDWSPLEWTGWISLKFKGLSRVFSNTRICHKYVWSNNCCHNIKLYILIQFLYFSKLLSSIP